MGFRGIRRFGEAFARGFGVTGGGAPNFTFDDTSPTVISPAVGSELFTDPGMEIWLSATDLQEYSETASVNKEATTIHGGSFAARMDIDASNTFCQIAQGKASANNWFRASAWIRASTASGVSAEIGLANSNSFALTDVYTQYITTDRATGVNVGFRRTSAANHSIYWDDVSLKLLSDLFVAEVGSVPLTVQGYNHWHVLPYRQAGGYLKYDATNFIYWYVNHSTNVVSLVKVIGGTHTLVASASITYSDTKAIYFKHPSANTWLIGYDTPANINAYTTTSWASNALINTSAVTDAALNQPGSVYEFGAFSTDSGNTPQRHRVAERF